MARRTRTRISKKEKLRRQRISKSLKKYWRKRKKEQKKHWFLVTFRYEWSRGKRKRTQKIKRDFATVAHTPEEALENVDDYIQNEPEFEWMGNIKNWQTETVLLQTTGRIKEKLGYVEPR